MNSPSDFLRMWEHQREFSWPDDGLRGGNRFLEI